MHKRLLILIETVSYGDKKIFCYRTGIKIDLLYSILNTRNLNPGYELFLKIKQTYPQIDLNWLIYGKNEITEPNIQDLNNQIKKMEKDIIKKDIMIDFLKTDEK